MYIRHGQRDQLSDLKRGSSPQAGLHSSARQWAHSCACMAGYIASCAIFPGACARWSNHDVKASSTPAGLTPIVIRASPDCQSVSICSKKPAGSRLGAISLPVLPLRVAFFALQPDMFKLFFIQ